MADIKESAIDSSDKDNAAYLKRREQVRRAQKTHRERKETYIKTLEAEVLLLRTNETRISQDNKVLFTEVERLRNIMEHHGILDSNYPVQCPSDQNILAQPSDMNGGSHLASRDHGNIGLDFASCLNPRYHPPAQSLAIEPQSLLIQQNAATPFLHHQPTQSTTHTKLLNMASPTWQSPGTDLKNVLEIKKDVPLNNELTPVQPWNLIHAKQEFDSFDASQSRNFTSGESNNFQFHGYEETSSISGSDDLHFWNDIV
ncbi:hypothetical protein B0J11DRAFT_337434 [Dendryphion nanum]|uniref:BZIP domain-containing protein n=1 Tax=Dendryphion nanum TaxID=256645 RepID=A0A9P9DN16_9PLEO|nr:hypothetical protein B0J11DRAFT_337434 [Dendryphion nanum]